MAKIIFVDDDSLMTRPFVQELELSGHSVRFFEDPSSLLNYIKRRPTVDLFVVDLMIPHGEEFSHQQSLHGLQTGVLLAKEIRKKYSETPILVFTSTPTERTHDEVSAKLDALGKAYLVPKSHMTDTMDFAKLVGEVLKGNPEKILGTMAPRRRSLGGNRILWFPTAISCVLIAAGVYFIISGSQTKTELKLGDWSVTTPSVGIVLILIAALVFVLCFRAVINNTKSNENQ